MGFLSGRKILIVGVLTDRSIAYGIAEAMLREGAELAFTYHSESVKEKVSKLVAKFNPAAVLPCDVSDDMQIEAAFAKLAQVWPKFNGIVHSVAFAPKEQLAGNYLDSVTRDGFRIAHDISSYSFAALAKASLPYLEENNSALLTLSYLGAERAVPNYNIMGLAKASLEANVRYMAASVGHMGVRVNGISAGPIRTLAASGIKDFKRFLSGYEKLTPLHRNVTLEQVGNAAAFLCSGLSDGITGEILHVDSGYHAVDPLAIEGE